MPSFKPFVPYRINMELLVGLSLEPTGNADARNRVPLSVTQVLGLISTSRGDYAVEKDGPDALNIRIRKDQYSFRRSRSAGILEVIISVTEGAGSGDVDGGLSGTWYFYENDCMRDDPHEYFYFFVCREDRVLAPSVSISSPMLSRLPQDFLQEDAESFLMNGGEDRRALTLLCYDKWRSETLPGRIFATKERMRLAGKTARELPAGSRFLRSSFLAGLAFLIAVGVLVPERYSTLILLGAIFCVLLEIAGRLRTRRAAAARISNDLSHDSVN